MKEFNKSTKEASHCLIIDKHNTIFCDITLVNKALINGYLRAIGAGDTHFIIPTDIVSSIIPFYGVHQTLYREEIQSNWIIILWTLYLFDTVLLVIVMCVFLALGDANASGELFIILSMSILIGIWLALYFRHRYKLIIEDKGDYLSVSMGASCVRYLSCGMTERRVTEQIVYEHIKGYRKPHYCCSIIEDDYSTFSTRYFTLVDGWRCKQSRIVIEYDALRSQTKFDAFQISIKDYEIFVEFLKSKCQHSIHEMTI